MKKQLSCCALLFAAALVLHAMPVLAAPPVQGSLDLSAAIFGPAECSAGAALDPEEMRRFGQGRPGSQNKAFPCDAKCSDGTYVGCFGNVCEGVDARCPYEKGYCIGNYSGKKVCPTCNQCKADGSKCV